LSFAPTIARASSLMRVKCTIILHELEKGGSKHLAVLEFDD
jgi:hypothetical protein